MKVTKRMLRSMIKEELAKMLNEQTTLTNRGGRMRMADRGARNDAQKFANRAYNTLFERVRNPKTGRTELRPRWQHGQTSAQTLAGVQKSDFTGAMVAIRHVKDGHDLHVSEPEFNSYLFALRAKNKRLFDVGNLHGRIVVAEIPVGGGEYGSGMSVSYVVGWEAAIKEYDRSAKILGSIKSQLAGPKTRYELPAPATIDMTPDQIRQARRKNQDWSRRQRAAAGRYRQEESKNKPQNQIILENHRRARQSHPVTKKEWWNEEV